MSDQTPAEAIGHIIKLYGGWKGALLAELRAVILDAAPEIEEAVKWRMPSRPEGLPVWMYNGNVCLAETFKNDIKLVFVHGAQLKDPHKLFNARLKSKTDRAIEFHDGDKVNKDALKALVQEAVEFNKSK